MKAYRELEMKGLAIGRPGQGTFIEATLNQVALPVLTELRRFVLRVESGDRLRFAMYVLRAGKRLRVEKIDEDWEPPGVGYLERERAELRET